VVALEGVEEAMSSECGDEPYSVQRDQVRRARKDHRCDACKETIRRGDLYHYFFGVFEGESEELKRCARCEAMYRVLQPRMDRAEYETCDPRLSCGHVWEERFREPPPVAVQALAFLTQAEAQVLLASWPAPLLDRDYLVTGPTEAPELTVARLLGLGRSDA
jgi:hypothetical protein